MCRDTLAIILAYMIFHNHPEKYFFWSVFCGNVKMDNKDGRKENIFPFNAGGSLKLI